MSVLVRAPLSCPLGEEHRGAVAVLGNLDGVHRGHQALLHTAEQLAAQEGAPLAAVTFEPHPRRAFDEDAPPFLLTTLAQKAHILDGLGATRVFALPFTKALFTLGPEAFVGDVLAGVLGLKGVVVGEDFRFGAKRAGDAEALRRLGEEHGLTVSTIGIQGTHKIRWSSTAARAALREGRPEDAAQIMGRPFRVTGPVLEGRRLARTLDYPTANQTLGDLLRPKYGVYAARAEAAGKTYDAVANIGVRPTVDGKEERLETHLFGFGGDLYGQTLSVDLLAFLREERTFDGIEALRAQIALDAETAKTVLLHHH